jgi:hypothetical protein
MPLARSLHKKAAVLPTSSIVILRRKGATFSVYPNNFPKFQIPAAASVLMGPADIALTRIPLGPRLDAIKRTLASRLALARPMTL